MTGRAKRVAGNEMYVLVLHERSGLILCWMERYRRKRTQYNECLELIRPSDGSYVRLAEPCMC